ncbi:phage portal protein, partial [Pseudomonas syringae pv. tagetis]
GLPVKVFDDQDGKRVFVPYKDREAMVLRKPNPYMTRLNFLKAAVVNMALRRNSYYLIERAAIGDRKEFLRVPFDSVEGYTA